MVTTKELTDLINSVMGRKTLTERQLKQILQGAKQAHNKGGMDAVLKYLNWITQADVDQKELRQFADSVWENPRVFMDKLKRGNPFG